MLPSVVTDAIDLYAIDTLNAVALVVAAGVVVYGGVMLLRLTEVLFAPSGGAGGGSSSADLGGVPGAATAPGFSYADGLDRYESFEISAKEDRKLEEFNAAAQDFGGVDGLRSNMDAVEASYAAMWADQQAQASANTAEYDCLADVWQGWTDQVENARASGGIAPAASQSLAFYDSLVERGMDAQDAIAAVEARNAAVQRSEAREAQEFESRTGRSYY
jgi:hypothetical protein